MVNHLVSQQRSKGFKVQISKLFLSAQCINEVFITLTEFEQNYLQDKQMLQSQYKAMYKAQHRDAECYLQDAIGSALDDLSTYPTKEIYNLVQRFEGRRVKYIEIIAVLFTGIMGVLIGSVLTGIFTR
jgi:hypothetical protein